MSHKADIQAYQQRWQQVEAVQADERRSASLELRWRQLNAAYGLAKSLGLIKPDPSEYEVYARWAKLKEVMLTRKPEA